MSRLPQTPDCGIVGCSRATYRAGLCRKHHAMLPGDNYLRAAIVQMQMAHEMGKKYRAEQVARVQAIVDSQAA